MSSSQPAHSSDTPDGRPVASADRETGNDASAPDTLAALDPEFLALFACPRCADRPPLRRGDDGASLICDRCGRVYPITDGFPDLRLTEEEIAAAAARPSAVPPAS